MVDPIVVVAYDPAWPAMFAGERERLVAALGELALAIEHHGSTAVPGLAAKPILDVMVAVPDLDDVDECTSRLERAGYNRRAVGDLAGRLYFHRAEGGRRLVHLSLAERDGASGASTSSSGTRSARMPSSRAATRSSSASSPSVIVTTASPTPKRRRISSAAPSAP
jgi:hypothetical protein